MMDEYSLELVYTETFSKWFARLRDKQAQYKINVRLERIQNDGNFGDCKSLGGELAELRIVTGKGYRVYYTIKNGQMVILLGGSTKANQAEMIKKAREVLKNEYS